MFPDPCPKQPVQEHSTGAGPFAPRCLDEEDTGSVAHTCALHMLSPDTGGWGHSTWRSGHGAPCNGSYIGAVCWIALHMCHSGACSGSQAFTGRLQPAQPEQLTYPPGQHADNGTHTGTADMTPAPATPGGTPLPRGPPPPNPVHRAQARTHTWSPRRASRHRRPPFR